MRFITTLMSIATVFSAVAEEPTRHQKPSAEQVFAKLDNDQSGGLSLAELQTKHLKKDPAKPEAEIVSKHRQEPHKRITTHFPEADADNSGELSLTEFINLKTIARTAAYKEIDGDANGMISKVEFQAHFAAKLAQWQAARANKVAERMRKVKKSPFARIDSNDDRSISMTEWLEHTPPRRYRRGQQSPQSDG